MDVVDTEVARRAELSQLEAEERALSRRRRQLHEKITFVRGGGRGIGPEAEALLFSLEAEELSVSAKRRRMHMRIDELREVVGREPALWLRSGTRTRIGT